MQQGVAPGVESLRRLRRLAMCRRLGIEDLGELDATAGVTAQCGIGLAGLGQAFRRMQARRPEQAVARQRVARPDGSRADSQGRQTVEAQLHGRSK